jgi:hypothetical protein
MSEESVRTIIMQRIWRRVLRFAYNRLKQQHGRLPNGIPGIRDVDHPCSGYTPLKPGEERGPEAQCMSDGHYMCGECVYFNLEKSDLEDAM